MQTMQVPFLDLQAHHQTMMPEIEKKILEVINQSAFAGGPYVEAFEREFAQFCEVEHAVGVGSGTDALRVALAALGVGPGAEVITVPNTFVATVEAICMCGAKPVLVDVDPVTCMMNPDALSAAITPRTQAIIPVHLFGLTVDMDPVLAVAERHGIAIVEDACQAHGARYRGRMAGSMGQAGCFSFYPGKNLGAFGEAGAVVTRDPDLAGRMRMIRDHGQSRRYLHDLPGWNGRMDGIQGAVLSIKLRHLPQTNAARRNVARQYGAMFDGIEGIIPPVETAHVEPVYHLYAVRVTRREQLMQAFSNSGIGYGIHYPIPIHLQQAYGGLGYRAGSFPVAEQCADHLLSLPMYAELNAAQVNHVASTVVDTLRSKHGRMTGKPVASSVMVPA